VSNKCSFSLIKSLGKLSQKINLFVGSFCAHTADNSGISVIAIDTK